MFKCIPCVNSIVARKVSLILGPAIDPATVPAMDPELDQVMYPATDPATNPAMDPSTDPTQQTQAVTRDPVKGTQQQTTL